MHYFIGPFDYNPHVIFDAVKALFYACDDEEPPILLLHLIPPIRFKLRLQLEVEAALSTQNQRRLAATLLRSKSPMP